MEMEFNRSNSQSNSHQPSKGSKVISDEKKPAESNVSDPLFVNHAEIAWHEMRRAWVGDSTQRSQTTYREPIISWTTSFQDLLLSSEPFPEPLPLADVVDFLVDIWMEENIFV